MPHELIDYNGDKITKTELARRMYLLNKELSARELVDKIAKETGIEISAQLIYTLEARKQNTLKKPKKIYTGVANIREPNTSNNDDSPNSESSLEGLKLLRKSVQLLGYRKAAEFISIFKD